MAQTARLFREPSIAPLADDPEYARLTALAAALRAAYVERERRIELMLIERELARPGSLSGGEQVRRLRERLGVLRNLVAVSQPAADTRNVPSEVGALLLRGEAVKAPVGRDERLAQLRTEVQLLDDESRRVSLLMDEVRRERSIAAAEMLRPRQEERLRAIYKAAVVLSEEIAAERQAFASLILAGYEPRPDILNRPALHGATLLGHLGVWDCELSNFKRRLEQSGVL